VREHALRMPDMELPRINCMVTAWFAQTGDRVVEGDRILEILADAALVEIHSPATGILIEACVAVNDTVTPEQLLAIIRER
jgi:2-oxoisovalerate dehydrogenase E2 component (dihydrolipoyl transacylase)